MNRDEKFAIAARVVTSIIFGCSFIFSKEALSYITPIQLLSYRFFVAAFLLYLLKRLKIININVSLERLNEMRPLLLVSFFQPIAGYYFEMQGIKRLTAAESGIMLALIPIIVTVMGVWVLKEKPNHKQVSFIALSFVGVLFILVIKDTSFANISISGSIFLLISAVFSGAYNILSRKVSTQFTYIDITYVMMVSGAIFYNVLNLMNCIITQSIESYVMLFQNQSIWIPAIYLGMISSVAGFLLTNYSLSKMTAFRVAIFNNLATVIAIIAAILIRKDPFSYLQIIGTIMIMIGVWGVNYFGYKNTQRKP